MDASYNLFHLMTTLSQLHEERKIKNSFIEGINEIFKGCECEIFKGDGVGTDNLIEIKTENLQFGFIYLKNPASLSEKNKILLERAVQLLAVFMEQHNLEIKVRKENIALGRAAETRLSELRQTVKELQSARNATLNLVEDLTEEIEKRKKYEQDLKESEEKYRRLFQNHAAVKLVIDPETLDLIDANESACNFYGWSIDEIRNKKLSQINILPEDEIRDKTKKVLSSKNFNFEFRHRKANGNIVDVEVYSSKIVIGGKEYLHSIVHDISTKKKAEKALRASEKNYRTLIDGMTETVWVMDFDGKLIDVNRTASEVLGYSKEELLSVGINGIDSFLTKEKIEDLIKNMPIDKLQVFDTFHKSKDGKIIPVEISSSVIKYQGKDSILSIARDISGRKKMEEQLRENEETIRLFLDSTSEGIYGMDLNGNCTFCNNAAIKMLGYSDVFEFIGKNMHELIHQYNVQGLPIPEANCEIARALKVGSGSHSDSEVFWKKNGKFFPVEYWSYPIIRNGRLSGTVVTFIDITKRKRDETTQQILYKIARTSMTTKALEDIILVVRRELDRVFDTSNFYVALYKPETETFERIIFVNEKSELSEWSAKDPLFEYLIRTGKGLLLNSENWDTFLAETGVEYPGIVPECWLGVPLMDTNGPVGVMVAKNYSDDKAYDSGSVHLLELIAHELTGVIQRTKIVQDLIKAKEKAEESDRLKSAFLTNMSHEIRTPMNGILGFLGLLNEPDLEEENRKEYIDIVNKSGKRLLDTINDIIEISKIEAGIIEVVYKTVNIAERMNFFQNFFRPQTDEKGIELEIGDQIPGEASIIQTDSPKLDGILTNLIKNAIKFTDKGSIQLGNYLEDGFLVFYVKDTGRGIPSDRLDAIFDRFVQGDYNLTRAHEGSGLGLSITKGYVDALGGKIWVHSAVGQGSTFFFSIPYRSVDSKLEPGHHFEFPAAPERQLNILVAEDDDTSFKFLKTILARERIDILHTENGQDTVKIVAENPNLSLVLMDIKMPGMDGLEATRQIRKFNKSIPIIAQTAYALSGDDEKAKEAGCDYYLTKPVNRKKLLDLINRFAHKRSS